MLLWIRNYVQKKSLCLLSSVTCSLETSYVFSIDVDGLDWAAIIPSVGNPENFGRHGGLLSSKEPRLFELAAESIGVYVPRDVGGVFLKRARKSARVG